MLSFRDTLRMCVIVFCIGRVCACVCFHGTYVYVGYWGIQYAEKLGEGKSGAPGKAEVPGNSWPVKVSHVGCWAGNFLISVS